jgi:hypothetical protein
MDKKIILIIGLLLFFNLNVSAAWTLHHYSRNAYNYEPLENVHVILYNNETNTSMDGFSNTAGLTDLTILLADEGNSTIMAIKPQYNEKSTNIMVADPMTLVSYLTYETESYTKFNFADMTFLKHEWCFYTEENRLFGCYYENDTVPLPVNHNYTAYPKLSMLEQAGFTNIAPFLIQISIFLIIGVILLALIIGFVLLLIVMVRKYL